MVWVKTGDGAGYLVKDVEEGIRKLLEIRQQYPDACVEFEGKRVRAKDMAEDATIDDAKKQISDITFEEYVTDFEEQITISDGDYSSFDMARDIEDIPDSSMRVKLTLHYIEKFWGIPAFTDQIARDATLEERKQLLEAYEKNGISVREGIFKPKLWIVPDNDLEAKTIIEMLKEEGQEYVVTAQGWGASWEMMDVKAFEELKTKGYDIDEEGVSKISDLDTKIEETKNQIWPLKEKEEENKERIAELEAEAERLTQERMAITSEMISGITSQAQERGVTIYGVELKGDSRGAVNVDHHIYGEDDRSNPKASIEQVAEIIGHELELEELFIAANDTGFIPGMEKLGEELGMRGEDIEGVIKSVRMKDRAAQGVTKEQEIEAEKAIEALGKIDEKQKLIVVHMSHSKASTLTDRLYGLYDNLLIISGDGETNFFGTTEYIEKLDKEFYIDKNTWKGGDLEHGNGYWGEKGKASQKQIEEFTKKIILDINPQKKRTQDIPSTDEI